MLIESLERQSGVPRSAILRIAETASKRYKTYLIEKRSGGRRIISHPSRELKAIQRWLNGALFRSLPVHEAATAYIKGGGIRENASRHLGSSFTLRMDFASFFPSFFEQGIREFLVESCNGSGIDLTEEDVDFVCAIVSRHGRLTIGAPSSPILTNAMMYDFDAALEKRCAADGLIYTRYADDVFVSATRPNVLSEIAEEIEDLASKQRFMRLRISARKTAHLSKKYRRSVTGLVLTPQGQISLGRERKRKIRALVHKFREGTLPIDQHMYLRGVLAFTSDVEKTFYESLSRKYGNHILEKIQNT